MDLGGAIGHKGDAICGHVCIKSRCEHFLSIVDKNLRAEPVQDQTKLDPVFLRLLIPDSLTNLSSSFQL